MGQLLLVRHGQASWGAADYDVLSDCGHDQAAATGRALAALDPDVVVHGTMKRQRSTAEELVAAAGWRMPVDVDERWNEMDHLALLERAPKDFEGEPDKRQFQAWFETATSRWLAGEHDHEYAEPFDGFAARVRAALEARQDGTVVVVTSGGPISVVGSTLLEGGRPAYRRMAPVVVNASVTKVVSGGRGLTLVSFNEHAHLTGDLLTYR